MTHEAGIEAACDVLDKQKIGADFGLVSDMLKAYLSASGMVLVPTEPTDRMLASTDDIVTHVYGGDYNGYMEPYIARQAWECMVSAAPDPFRSKP